MTKFIEGQVITSTGVDLDGESLSREEIRHFYEKMSDNFPLVARHDMSTEPFARAFNKRIEELPNGELAIKVDIEIFNEEEFAKFGGMSIGFIRHGYRFGSGDPVAEITLNNKQFDVEACARQIAAQVGCRFPFEVLERVEKTAAITTAIIVIAASVAVQTLGGFFRAFGAELYEIVKRLLRRDRSNAPAEIHYHLHLHSSTRTPVVVLAVDPACTAADLRQLDQGAILTAIQVAGGVQNLQRIAGTIQPGGKVVILHIIDAQGRPIT